MNLRYQHGHLRCVERKNGPRCWEFLWRETDALGKRVRRNTVIGTIEEYPTEALAQAAINGLRTCMNENRNRQREQPIFVDDLIDHYVETELAERNDWRSHATRIVYREFLTRWIKPHWGSSNIRDVRTVAVERWLKQPPGGRGENSFQRSWIRTRSRAYWQSFNHLSESWCCWMSLLGCVAANYLL